MVAAVSFVLLDGPMGTELERRGVHLSTPGWSADALLKAPEVVAAVHRDYVLAGATVHTANTFRTHRRAVGARWEELTRMAVRIARAAVAEVSGCRATRIAGSLGPLADCYRPDLSPGAAARSEHGEVGRILADEGVDLLLCETFCAPGEAVAAVEAAASTGVETWVSLTAGPDGALLSPAAMGTTARSCVSAGARAVLVNCTSAALLDPFVDAIAQAGAPFGVYANAGGPADGLGWDARAESAATKYLAMARGWIGRGATMVGGCCGTGPAHIARLAKLRSLLTND
jgi:S-methylmethionine-dependent homocysteine/selenocysteine methylase